MLNYRQVLITTFLLFHMHLYSNFFPHLSLLKLPAWMELAQNTLKCFPRTLLTDSIIKLCNVSIAEGQFPDSWKIARVIPLFKKGSDADVNNYRPISILHLRCRLFHTKRYFI